MPPPGVKTLKPQIEYPLRNNFSFMLRHLVGRTGGGGFPVYKRPFNIRLGRPSRALLGLTILSSGFHLGLM